MERDDALVLANKILERPHGDPDDDLAVLARQLLRARERMGVLLRTLDATHKLVTEGALTGFIPTAGTWADRLYRNQGAIHDALNPK